MTDALQEYNAMVESNIHICTTYHGACPNSATLLIEPSSSIAFALVLVHGLKSDIICIDARRVC